MSPKTFASKKRTSKTSLGKELTTRLSKFVTELERTDDLKTRFTVRTIKLNLVPNNYTAELVRGVRQQLRASQAVFAQFLGVSVSTVQDWEQGNKPPRGSACRLMDEIRTDPGYWNKRLQELAIPAKA
ncbi:MAG: helix-turn-helix domain-containing protein [Planctomycetales bacterium]|nr:helix-turn-helix domain-containing protein [Planctomycetales bacterium]